ncbi:MAG: hypothetical protein SFV52_16275 [Saprospiraceae bacterium]|nr:hypothetical protein [Saprospiraceae bacterium]
MKTILLLFPITVGTYFTAFGLSFQNDPPVLNCLPVVVNLNNEGVAILNATDIPFTATNNCGDVTPIPSSVIYTCSVAGSTQGFALSVTDTCGNIGSCVVKVTVNPFDRCHAKISVPDPCRCKNNATTMANGQFEETVYVRSLTGKSWTVASANGFFLPSSPAPPAGPVPVTAGTVLEEYPAGSGDYRLPGVHVDSLGYSLTVVSNAGDTLSISNGCRYPEIAIVSAINNTLCLYSTPLTLNGLPGDDHFLDAQFTINGQQDSVFDPGALGIGTYLIRYTVNGGQAKFKSTGDPGCVQWLELGVQVVPTPSTVVCNDHVQVSFDENCVATITPDLILEGSYGCFDDYRVTLADTFGVPVTNPPGLAQAGHTLVATVEHLGSGNTCWGRITLEDKLAPVLTCVDLTVPCALPDLSPTFLTDTLGIAAGRPEVAENCTPFSLTHTDTYVDEDCSSQGVSARLVRAWQAIDAFGNQGNCTQNISLERIRPGDLVLPADTVLPCDNPQIDPTSTGLPGLSFNNRFFPLFPNNFACEVAIVYTDKLLPACKGAYTVLRTWTLADGCSPAVQDTNPFSFIQAIRVEDNQGPVVNCPGNLTVDVLPTGCTARVDLPDLFISDNCSGIASLRAEWTLSAAPFGLSGSLSDFPGNNPGDRDTLGVLGLIDLPRGLVPVRYIIADECGNTSTCLFTITVEDQVPPVAACKEFVQVSLGSGGSALLFAESLNNGSYDNCNGITLKVRRLQVNSCQPNNRFFDEVRFCCEDVRDTVDVLLRVYDIPLPVGEVSLTFLDQNINECVVKVLVDDKIKPACLPPADVTVSCENFDFSLAAYGVARVLDNCCADTVTVNNLFSTFDTVCNRGTVSRIFRAMDCAGLVTQCTQRVFVTPDQGYFIRFPDDALSTFCDSFGLYGQPQFFGEDCELLALSHQDEIFNLVPDACYKIERTWKIINWCTYDPNKPCIRVPNPEPVTGINQPANLPGPVVSAPNTTGAWAASQVRIKASDVTPTNFSVFWDSLANCYTYQQIIKVIDAKQPEIIDCPAQVAVCDLSDNDPLFWHASTYTDPLTGQHDLCETPTDLHISATDDCSGTEVNFRYLLFLDLDQDDDMETVVSSTNLPGYNTIHVGNALLPNYQGGTPLGFDHRPVPANQKFGFALQITTAGNTRTARVAWNTAQNPGVYVDPQLPYGKHKIKWFVTDNCGNESVCEYSFDVQDCKKPTVACLNGLSVNIMASGAISLNTSDFLQYADDNCTPSTQLRYGLRRAGTGTGFPEDVQGNPIQMVDFTCTDLGKQYVELWAKDLAGNADFCQAQVNIQDNMQICDPDSMAQVAGFLLTDLQTGLANAELAFEVQSPAGQSFMHSQSSDNSGFFSFLNILPPASAYVVTPKKTDNPLNGVSTYDLVLISRHILGIEPIANPYRMIAADANKSGSITTFDIVELRKLILGIYTTLPNNHSWRFVDKAFGFTNPANPFQPSFPEHIAGVLPVGPGVNHDFVAIKVGDVNGNAIPAYSTKSNDRSAGALLFDTEDREVSAGELCTVTFQHNQQVLGYQLTLHLNGLEVAGVTPGEHASADHFGVFADALTVSAEGDAAGAFSVTFRARKGGQLSEMMSVSDRITRAEAYDLHGNLLDVALRFKDQRTQNNGFALLQNHPNPFTDKTVIGFYLPEQAVATLTISDESGRVCYSQTEPFTEGYNTVLLDGSMLPEKRVLYYRLETDRFSEVRKMVRAGN